MLIKPLKKSYLLKERNYIFIFMRASDTDFSNHFDSSLIKWGL